MRLLTINTMFSWFTVSMVYYGLILNGARLSGVYNGYIISISYMNEHYMIVELYACPVYKYTARYTCTVHFLMEAVYFTLP